MLWNLKSELYLSSSSDRDIQKTNFLIFLKIWALFTEDRLNKCRALGALKAVKTTNKTFKVLSTNFVVHSVTLNGVKCTYMYLFLTLCKCVYVCVCVHSSHFILTSVVLTGLSWGAVLTDRQKEKQQQSEASKCHQHQPATQPSSRYVQHCTRLEKKIIRFRTRSLYRPDTYRICRWGERIANKWRKRSFTLPQLYSLVPDP